MGSLDLSHSDGNDVENSSGMAINISGEVMTAAVVFVFLLFILVLFLYLYFKYYLDGSSSPRRFAQLISAAGHATNPSRGVESSTVRSIPVIIYKQSEFKDWLECSVCLCDLTDGEETRLLPKCNHGFHLECIDTWFQSHSTCPLCRCPVGSDTAIAVREDAPVVSVSGDRQALESLALPTNVLFWGNQEGVNIGVSFPREMNSSSSASAHFRRTLVISVPGRSRMIGGFPLLHQLCHPAHSCRKLEIPGGGSKAIRNIKIHFFKKDFVQGQENWWFVFHHSNGRRCRAGVCCRWRRKPKCSENSNKFLIHLLLLPLCWSCCLR
ncbi:hypothetical protein HPP92_004337 [Vanilla planifolia]|uniref:RING-type E3 ubiquitin transferase n=1 Tax=Vanilla planifolia TaxID=51239 RepID=A0A835VK87_VANPL|nr:hypothetical protein HPP92_004337 [Vanilla planifolia]